MKYEGPGKVIHKSMQYALTFGNVLSQRLVSACEKVNILDFSSFMCLTREFCSFESVHLYVSVFSLHMSLLFTGI